MDILDEGINIKEILFTPEQIQEKVIELAKRLTIDYKGSDLIMIGILRGAAIFMADLIRQIELPMAVDFMATSSYGKATESTGVVRIVKDLNVNIKNKDALIIEDIIDTGLTYNYLREALGARRPNSIRICTLLDKPSCRKIDINAEYVGFEIPNKFVVGYGLDYKELYRNLPYVCELNISREER